MKIVDTGKRTRRWPARLLLLCLASIIALAGLGFFRYDFLRRVKHDPKGMLYEAPKNYIHARLHAPSLDEIHVHIKFKDYEKLLAKRNEALRVGILITNDNDEVPAQLEVGDRTIPVKIRLKGDWPDHFETDKWSFRVETRKGTQYHGMRRFSLQHPRVRRYLGEWLFLQSMRQEGILAPHYDFVRVTINGKSKGIFAIEEHFAKELLESEKRTEAPIAKFDEDPHWEQRRISHNEFHLGWFDLDHLNFRTAKVDFFSEAKLSRDPVLKSQMEAARHLLEGFQRGTLTPSQVFDVEKMARFLALCRIWGADHSLIWHNLRFYYNPVTARLEPIAFDGEPWGWSREDMARSDVIDGLQLSLGWGGWYPWMRSFLADKTALSAYMKALWRYSDPGWSQSLLAEYGKGLQDRLLALQIEWPQLTSPVPPLLKGQRFYRGKLQPLVALNGEYAARGDSLSIRLTSVCDIPLEVLGFTSGDQRKDLPEPLLLPSHRPLEELKPRQLRVALAPPADGKTVHVIYRALALPATQRNCLLRPTPPVFEEPAILPPAPTDPAAFAKTKPWLDWNPQERQLTVQPGEWHLDEDLVLPAVRTRLSPGVTLRMAPGVIILARAPLDLAGTRRDPVRLLPAGDHWSGLVLMSADSLSRWNHVEVRDTVGIDRPGWFMTGGISFYASPIEISNSHFEGHRGEDALHFVHSKLSVLHTIVGSCHSDAIDGDFVQGTLSDCSFHDVGGDAIDLSGSTVEVYDLEALRIADKAISAGENSHMRVSGCRVDQAGIGVASKDLSSVIIQEGTIRNVRIGLAAYIKKPVYGPATIVASHLDVASAEELSLVQTLSHVRLNGTNMESSDFNAKQLYALGILGN